VTWRLILLFNKIRFENKICIEMWVNFGILESYVGERVNKIRFVGSINKAIRLREKHSTYVSEEKGRKRQREGETWRAAISSVIR